VSIDVVLTQTGDHVVFDDEVLDAILQGDSLPSVVHVVLPVGRRAEIVEVVGCGNHIVELVLLDQKRRGFAVRHEAHDQSTHASKNAVADDGGARTVVDVYTVDLLAIAAIELVATNL